MSKYRLEYDKKVIEQLKKLDRPTRAMTKQWIDLHLVDTDAPRAYGTALVGNKRDYWRYRVGDYRIVARIKDDVLVITATDIAHRKHVYKAH